MNLVTETLSGFWSLVTGLRLTLKEFFSPPITVHYPHQTLPIPKAYRGHIELKWNEETGRPNCTSCGICAKACPSNCIDLEGIKPAGEKTKVVTRYELNFTLCSLCSLCVEACPFDAIQHSPRYNLASVPNKWADMDLVQRYREQVTRAGKTPFIPQAAPAPVAATAPSDKVQAPSAKTTPVGASAPTSNSQLPTSPAAAVPSTSNLNGSTPSAGPQ